MGGKIYLLQANGSLQPMSEHAYVSEEKLQLLLKEHPELLAGEQINEEEPRRWLLISREVGIPFEEGGREWMSLDHLFLDQDGIPTLVEVKRSRDVRIRREVVGQMLDYAANAVAYWPIERLRARFEAACDQPEDDPDSIVADLIEVAPDDQESIESFWEDVKTNLRAGRIRMVFVADDIPSELKRIVEFLNVQMDPAEVLAVAVKQYIGEDLKTMVPQLIGRTAASEQKSTRVTREWDEHSFMEELERRKGSQVVAIARSILAWAEPRVTRIWWGQGTRNGSFVPVLSHKGVDHQLFAVWTRGSIEVYFQYYQHKAPFESEQSRKDLLNRLNAIEGVSFPADSITRRPSIWLSVLGQGDRLDQLLSVFDWMIEEIREQ
jgi:hypothetical protein